jgi:hypothetical protein
LLGKITGSGCALGSTVASYLVVHKEDKLLAVLAAILHYEIAAERAARKAEGTRMFIPAFLDQLYIIPQAAEKGDKTWLRGMEGGIYRALNGARPLSRGLGRYDYELELIKCLEQEYNPNFYR